MEKNCLTEVEVETTKEIRYKLELIQFILSDISLSDTQRIELTSKIVKDALG